jgi:hypothetical protein
MDVLEYPSSILPSPAPTETVVSFNPLLPTDEAPNVWSESDGLSSSGGGRITVTDTCDGDEVYAIGICFICRVSTQDEIFHR